MGNAIVVRVAAYAIVLSPTLVYQASASIAMAQASMRIRRSQKLIVAT